MKKFTLIKSLFLLAVFSIISATTGTVKAEEFVKITSLNELTTGRYVITNNASASKLKYFAMTTETTGAFFKHSAVTIANNTITTTENIWNVTLESDGKISITTPEGGFLTDKGTVRNVYLTTENNTTTTKWTPSITSGFVTLKANGNYYLQYNSVSPRFTTYASGQQDLLFFKEKTLNPNEVGIPEFTPQAGTYYNPQTITLTSATTGATIYYTTDGTDPSAANGTQYTAPIVLNASGLYTIRAIAIKDGLASEITSAEYTLDLPTPGVEFYTYNFVNEPKFPTGGNTATTLSADYTLNNVTWNLYAVAKKTTNIYSKNDSEDKGWHFGSGTNPADTLQFSTSAFTDRVQRISINACGGNAGQKLTVTVGGKPFGEPASLTTSSADYKFIGDATGEIVITFVNNADKAVYLMSFDIKTDATPLPPTFDTPADVDYNKDINVKINAEAGITYRYTLDGSTPTATTGTEYDATTGIAIAKNTTTPVVLTAVAIRNYNGTDLVSDAATATYTFADFNDVYLAGDMNSWADDADYLLDYNSTTQHYTITKALSAGTYKFKLKIGGSWNTQWGFVNIDGATSTWGYEEDTDQNTGEKNGNILITLPVDGEISIDLNSVDGKISLNTNLLYFGNINYDIVRVAGFSVLCGSEWDANDANNNLTLNAETGKYTLTLEKQYLKTTDELKYKWLLASSTDANALRWQDGEDNIITNVTADGLYDVTFTFDKYEMACTLTAVEGVTPVTDFATFIASDPVVNNNYYFVIPVTVTYKGGKNIYLTDGTTAYYMYDNDDLWKDLVKQNTVINGMIATYSVYKNACQLKPVSYKSLTTAEVTPADIEIQDMSSADIHRYVRLTNVQFAADATLAYNSTLNITDDDNLALQLYNKFVLTDAVKAGNRYDIVGIVGVYNSVLQIQPSEIIARPTIVLTPASGETATVANGTIDLGTVNYNTAKEVHRFVNLDMRSDADPQEALRLAFPKDNAFAAVITAADVNLTPDATEFTGAIALDFLLNGTFASTTGTPFYLVGATSGEIYYEGMLQWTSNDATAADAVVIDGIDIITDGSALVITSDHATTARIYNATGALVATTAIDATTNTITLATGIYFINIDGKTTRAIIR